MKIRSSEVGSMKVVALTTLAGVMILAAGLLIWTQVSPLGWLTDGGSSNQPSNQTPDGDDSYFADLKGDVYMTLARNGSFVSNIYRYSIENDSVAAIDGVDASDVLRITSKTRPGGKEIAYFETVLGVNVNKDDGNSATFFPSLTNPWKLIVRDVASGTVRTIGTIRTPGSARYPQWSPDGTKLAFTTLGGDFYDPDAWVSDIVRVPDSGRYVTEYADIQGKYPLWAPDGGSIITMRSDGVYQTFLSGSTTQSTKVIPLPHTGTTTVKSKMGLSADGSLLGWGIPGDPVHSLYVYEITSWTPFMANIKYQEPAIDGEDYYWPVFSPDGKYMMVQRIRRGLNDVVLYSDLVVYHLDSGKSKVVTSLSGYNGDMLFLSDWQ